MVFVLDVKLFQVFHVIMSSFTATGINANPRLMQCRILREFREERVKYGNYYVSYIQIRETFAQDENAGTSHMS